MEYVDSKAVDSWSLVHLAAGYFAAMAGLGLVPILVGAVAWEVIERELEKQTEGTEWHARIGPESPANRGTDIAAAAAGYFLQKGL